MAKANTESMMMPHPVTPYISSSIEGLVALFYPRSGCNRVTDGQLTLEYSSSGLLLSVMYSNGRGGKRDRPNELKSHHPPSILAPPREPLTSGQCHARRLYPSFR